MLLGYYSAKLDEKGRLAIPKHFRVDLDSELVVARWYEKCLLLIKKSLWEEYVGRLTGGELASLGVRDTDRFLLAGSFEVNPDSQGRFVIPQVLREYAGILGEVVVAGLGDKLEIWDKRAWNEREKLVMGEAGEKIERLYRERTSLQVEEDRGGRRK